MKTGIKTIQYSLTLGRICWMLLTPFLMSALLVVCIFSKIYGPIGFKFADYFAWPILFLLFVGGYLYLFANHFSLANNTQVLITYQDFEIVQNGIVFKGNFKDIKRIVEYTPRRLPWMSIVKWDINVADQTVVLSSLTISKSSFERYFYNKIEDQFVFFPRI